MHLAFNSISILWSPPLLHFLTVLHFPPHSLVVVHTYIVQSLLLLHIYLFILYCCTYIQYWCSHIFLIILFFPLLSLALSIQCFPVLFSSYVIYCSSFSSQSTFKVYCNVPLFWNKNMYIVL